MDSLTEEVGLGWKFQSQGLGPQLVLDHGSNWAQLGALLSLLQDYFPVLRAHVLDLLLLCFHGESHILQGS
jgi:hypothetical protein